MNLAIPKLSWAKSIEMLLYGFAVGHPDCGLPEPGTRASILRVKF